MHKRTWAFTLGEAQWKMGRTSRSTVLRERKARSTPPRLLYDGSGVVEGGRRQVGAHDINAVQSGLLGDGLFLAAELEAIVLDGRLEVLGHLALVERGADLQRDCGLAAQRISGAADRLGDRGEAAFGGFQQVLALRGPQARQFRIAADH